MQFIGWVLSFCIHTDVVLDSIINKLQCSVFCVKKAINKVPVCAITSILSCK